MKTILNEVAHNFSLQAKAKNISIHLVKDTNKVFVRVDRDYLAQIFQNLLSNAIKFSPKNQSIYLHIEESGKYYLSKIKDEGPGISESDQKKLFTKYQKLSAKPTDGEDSTGLGLVIVKKYVEAMGGRIWCESTLGQGATFIVELKKYQ